MASPFVKVPNGENVAGLHKRNIWDVTGPTSYVNGTGFAVYPQNVGLKSILALDFMAGNATAQAYTCKPITPTAPVLAGQPPPSYVRVYVQSTGAEVANATNLSTSTFRFEAIGK
jgi:hypothetical protein